MKLFSEEGLFRGAGGIDREKIALKHCWLTVDQLNDSLEYLSDKERRAYIDKIKKARQELLDLIEVRKNDNNV